MQRRKVLFAAAAGGASLLIPQRAMAALSADGLTGSDLSSFRGMIEAHLANQEGYSGSSIIAGPVSVSI